MIYCSCSLYVDTGVGQGQTAKAQRNMVEHAIFIRCSSVTHMPRYYAKDPQVMEEINALVTTCGYPSITDPSSVGANVNYTLGIQAIRHSQYLRDDKGELSFSLFSLSLPQRHVHTIFIIYVPS